mgnify:CR=1 FL=1
MISHYPRHVKPLGKINGFIGRVIKFKCFLFLDLVWIFRFLKRRPSQGVRGFGGEKLCLFTSKAMAALRWFLPRESNCIIMEQVKLEIFAIPWFSKKSFIFLWPGEGTALRHRSKLWLAAVCRHDALQAKKRDIFPAGKVWFLPPRPRRYFRAAEIRYLAQKRDKYFDAISRQIFLPSGY